MRRALAQGVVCLVAALWVAPVCGQEAAFWAGPDLMDTSIAWTV